MDLSIIDRTVGIYTISIGTSLAIEGLTHTGEFESNKGVAPITKCEALYINIRTLFRNAFGSFDDLKNRLTLDVIKETILDDLKNIKEVVSATSPNTVCVPYFCEYKNVNKKIKEAKFKNANTPNQVFYNTMELDFYRMAPDLIEDLEVFDFELKGDKDTYIITHLPIDLLSFRNFPSLNLLESHTGKVKNRMMWYTKLNGKHQMIPFNRAMLIIFGDGIMFSPQSIKIRRVILKVAEKHRWTQATTMDKIKFNLRSANEPHVLEFITRLNKV